MSGALSQSQIDELLNRMRGGSTEESEKTPVIKKYDFYSPKKFTKDQLNSLTTLFETYARNLDILLTNLTHTVTEITVTGIEEIRYNEFNNSLPEMSLISLATIDLEKMDYSGSLIMTQFPTNYGFYLINRVLGGNEIAKIAERDFTEIELAILHSIFESVAENMTSSWEQYFQNAVNLQSVETNGRMLQVFSPQDIMVLVSIEVKDELFTGTVNVCMPAENLENLIESSNVKLSRTVKQQDPEREQIKKDLVFDYLKTSDVHIEAILEKSKMEIYDLASLQAGDVVVLNKRYDSNIEIELEGIPWCTAKLGESHNNKAFKIVELINNEKNEG